MDALRKFEIVLTHFFEQKSLVLIYYFFSETFVLLVTLFLCCYCVNHLTNLSFLL